MKDEVREGYKKTEIGEIPVEWEIKNLGEVVDSNKKNSFTDGDWIEADYIIDFGIRLIQTGNIGIGNYIEKEDKKYISEKTFIELKCKEVEPGDILICRMAEPTGRSCIVPDLNWKMITSVDCTILKIDKNKFDNRYINYFLNTPENLKRINKFEQGSTRKRITRTNLGKVKVPIPPLKEQQKIASILSTVDEYIEQTDKLIEKTKEFKKGLMQKLLTKGIGHTEFKKTEIGEIPKGWEVKKIEEIADVVTGKTPPTKNKEYYGEQYPWVTPTDIEGKRDIFKTERQLSEKGFNEKAVQLPANTVLVTCIASIGKNAILRQKGSCNQQINAILPKDDYNAEYIYYWISNNSCILNSYAAQTAVPILNKNTFKIIKIPVPPLQEQQKIASILSEVDNQIEQYELKKEKLQNLKKGLMQNLLTGRKRVRV